MEHRSESSAGRDVDSTTTISKSTAPAKRPLTKPVAPRLSNLTRPTSSSTARTSSTPSTLNKPPARPVLSTRRQNVSGSSVATTNDGTTKRLSVSSVEGKTSGDEVRREGITAKPKRMSLASSTTSDRPSSARSTVASTSIRGTTSSAAIARQNAATTSSRPLTTSRTTTATTPRARPLSTTGRNLVSSIDRKRLSTIPASPAVKLGAEESEDNKENDHARSPAASGSEWTQDEEEIAIQSETEDQTTRTRLQTELEQSRSQVAVLEEQIGVLTTKIDEFSQLETGKDETSQEVEALQRDYESRIEQIHNEHQELLELERSEVTKLKQDLVDVSSKYEEDRTRHDNDQARIVELEQDLDDTRENARRTLADLKTELQSKFEENEQVHTTQIADLTTKLAAAVSELATKQSEISVMGDDHARTLGNINNEVSRQSQVIKMLQEQINVSQQSRDEQASSKDMLIACLQKDIADLGEAKTSELDEATARLADVQKQHAMELQTMQNQLNEAKQGLEKSSTDIEDKTRLRIEELQKANADGQEELSIAKEAHIQAVIELQSSLRVKEEEISERQSEHDQQLFVLKTEIESSQQGHQDALAKNKQQADVYAARLADLESTIETASSTHVEQMLKLDSDLRKQHEKALHTLQKSHNEQIEMLESQSRSALKDLEGLEVAHAKNLEKVQSEAVEAHQNNLEKVTLAYRTEVRELKKQLQDATDMATSLRDTHEKALNDNNEMSKREHEDSISKLVNTHNEHEKTFQSTIHTLQKQVDELKVQNQDSLEDLEKRLHKEHQERFQQLDSHSQSIASDLEDARIQVDSMKAVLASVEKEAEKRAKEDALALSQVQDELEKARSEAVKHVKKMGGLEKEHASALEQMKTTFDRQSQHNLDQTAKDHEVALAGLRESIVLEHKSARERMQEEHSASIEKVKAQHQSVIQKLEHSSAKKLDELRNRLKTEAAALEAMEKEAVQRQDKAASDNQKAIEVLKAEHGETVRKLQNQVQNAQEELKNRNQDYGQNMRHLEEKLSQQETIHQESHQSQTHALNRLKEGHATEIKKLNADLDQLKRQLVETSNTAKETVSLRSRLGEAEKIVIELRDVLNATDLRIETEKNRADAAVATVEQLKQTLEQVKNDQSRQLQETQANGQRAGINGTRSRTPSKMGLSSSKWATPDVVDEGTPSKTPKPKLSPTAAPFSPGQSFIIQSQSPSQTPTTTKFTGPSRWRQSSPRPSPKSPNFPSPLTESRPNTPSQSSTMSISPAVSSTKTNTQAQLALIRENLRQLKDINDEFLEEHENLAKTLNRHGDVIQEYRNEQRNQISKAMEFKSVKAKRNSQKGRPDGKENGHMDGDTDGNSQSGIVEVIENNDSGSGDGY